jgi:hypothetical protein
MRRLPSAAAPPGNCKRALTEVERYTKAADRGAFGGRHCQACTRPNRLTACGKRLVRGQTVVIQRENFRNG